jgi:hypothetical protein
MYLIMLICPAATNGLTKFSVASTAAAVRNNPLIDPDGGNGSSGDPLAAIVTTLTYKAHQR